MIQEMATDENCYVMRGDTQISVNFTDALSSDEFALKSYVDARFDKQNYKAITASFGNSTPKTYEKGTTVTSVEFNITFTNQKPTAVTWNGNEVTALVGKQSGTVSATGSWTTVQSWTLSAHHETAGGVLSSNATATAKIQFQDYVFYGVATMPETIDSAFVRALSEKDFYTAFPTNKKFTINAGESQYIWFALPITFGKAGFKIDGFGGGFDPEQIVSVKNGGGSGTDVSYYVYHTTNPSLGSCEITIVKPA